MVIQHYNHFVECFLWRCWSDLFYINRCIYYFVHPICINMFRFASKDKSVSQQCVDCSSKCEQSFRGSGSSHPEVGSLSVCLIGPKFESSLLLHLYAHYNLSAAVTSHFPSRNFKKVMIRRKKNQKKNLQKSTGALRLSEKPTPKSVHWSMQRNLS